MSTENAIAKVNAEMQKDPTNMYLEIIGHYLIDRCAEEQAAEAVMADSKTLSGAMSAIESAARAQKHGNCAVLKDNDIFDAVDKYFGLPRSDAARAECILSVDGERPSAQPKKTGALDLDFSDFL